jgi:large subunit ribosomal protein L16
LAVVSEEIAKESMRLAHHKLAIKTKFVNREETGVKKKKTKENS